MDSSLRQLQGCGQPGARYACGELALASCRPGSSRPRSWGHVSSPTKSMPPPGERLPVTQRRIGATARLSACGICNCCSAQWAVNAARFGEASHQQCCRSSPAPVGDSAQDQPWRPIPPWRDLPQPPAHGQHHPAATGPRYLAVPGAGLDWPSPRRGDAITTTGSLR